MLQKPTIHIAVTTATMLASFAAGPAFSEDAIASALPGGASSLQETYDDWMVACAVND
jgi:invasion protein IalB